MVSKGLLCSHSRKLLWIFSSNLPENLSLKNGGDFGDFFFWSLFLKNLLVPLFLMGCFPVDFQEVKRPLRTKSGKRPIKVGKRPIKEGKRPIKAVVLVGIAVGCLMGCFRAPPPWRKTAPLKRPIKRSMSFPRNEARKLLEKFGENSERNSEQTSGRELKDSGNFCSATFLT